MDSSVLEKHYQIATYLINFQGRLGLYYLLNLLQDVATSHAHQLGFGTEDMGRAEMFWVLTRQKLVMNHWPRWNEELKIKTWVRPQKGPLSFRDFTIHYKDEVIGECTTSWLSLNAKTRRPVTFDRSYIFSKLQDVGKVSIETRKIPVQTNVERMLTFHVRNSDIDHNMHVNNTKYAQWILDAVPMEAHMNAIIKSYEINFIAETKVGDELTIQRGETQEGIHFQGLRESDQKIVFTAYIIKG